MKGRVMIKSSELLVVVDSVDEAVKFYTEKLAFDLVDADVSTDGLVALQTARLRKGKCHIIFKAPLVEELAEFSFIKRCSNRCTGLSVEMKKGVEKYFQRCKKKALKIVQELRVVGGHKTFSMRDPFGIIIVVTEVPEKHPRPSFDFVGLRLSEKDVVQKQRPESAIIDDMVSQLRKFGILRRAGKKFAKLRLKQLTKK